MRRKGFVVLAVLGGLLVAPALASARVSAPTLRSPGAGAAVQSVPAFIWNPVRGAAQYEFELSADRRFSSTPSGFGQGAIRLNTTAITGDKAIPDGTYYWRVRGVTAADHAGSWSRTRTLVKSWTTAPTLTSPANGTVLTWPGNLPLLRWSAVPHAAQYDIWVATDPGLSNLVMGSVSTPTYTDGMVAAMSSDLAPGTYYWGITPVDAEGHRGPRSAVGSFVWSWPSATTPSEANIAQDPGSPPTADPAVVDPDFAWPAVPGAARYEVEVNTSQDFAAGSKLCCTDTAVGTSLTPRQLLPNVSTLYWRMRAVDVHGDAGTWNVGTPFTESFLPSVANLSLRDTGGNSLAAGSPTDSPIITWNQVPGASSYEIDIAPYESLSSGAPQHCYWASGWDFFTATTAWTPLGTTSPPHVGPQAWPSPQSGHSPAAGSGSYCFQIRARRDDSPAGGGGQIISNYTQLGGPDQPAFQFTAQSAGTEQSPFSMPANGYISPANGALTHDTPYFTWSRVLGATGYYVVVARDAAFTDVVDTGWTSVPAYAPRIANKAPFADETSAYYWAVMPVDSSGYYDPNVTDDNPQMFNKLSVPPMPLSPQNGSNVSTVPAFHWTVTEGAKHYELQVAGDPSFSNPLEDVTTDSTQYTSEAALPADRTLYWRVRAQDVGNNWLNWSTSTYPVGAFTHFLPVPIPSSGNPTSGSMLPAFSWSPVDGATAYDVHFEQADGTTKDFTFDGPLFYFEYWYGTGIWRWQVRADFPGRVSGAYSPMQSYVRVIPAPAQVNATKSGQRIIISWGSDPVAKRYQVQLSTTDGFGSTVASDTTDNTVWVPQISSKVAAHTLYWRLAAVDTGGNIGAYDTGIFHAPRKHHAKAKRCKKTRHHRCPAVKKKHK